MMNLTVQQPLQSVIAKFGSQRSGFRFDKLKQLIMRPGIYQVVCIIMFIYMHVGIQSLVFAMVPQKNFPHC